MKTNYVDWNYVNKQMENDPDGGLAWARLYAFPEFIDPLHSPYVPGLELMPKWNIPKEIAICPAIVGGMYSKKSNPNQPITVEEIRKEALEVCEAGAANVHVHVRDDVYGNNVLDVKKFHQVIDPIREKYPDISVCGCVVPGGPDDWNGMEQVFKDGLFDQTPINTQACFMGDVAAVKPPHVMLKKAEMCLKYDVKVQLAVYSDGDIDNARRYLIDSGMLPKPYYWVLLPGILGCSPMYSPTDMFDVLLSYVRRIREIDSESQIMVVSGGRASSYLTAAAMLLGLHVRVGKEDTIWKYPHSDELIESNVEIYKNTVAMARLLGREPATIDQCVEMFGLKRRAGKIIK